MTTTKTTKTTVEEKLQKVFNYSMLNRVNKLQMRRLYNLIDSINEQLEEVELNKFADPSRACNGEGYHQPAYYYEDDLYSYSYEDTSCGEFGNREFWEIQNKRTGAFVSYYYDTMNNCISEYLSYNNIIIYEY